MLIILSLLIYVVFMIISGAISDELVVIMTIFLFEIHFYFQKYSFL